MIFPGESLDFPQRFVALKEHIASSYPDFEANITKAWTDIIEQLKTKTKDISAQGPDYIPQVAFDDLDKLKPEEIDVIKSKGSVVIRDVVDDAEAASWKTSLEEYVKANPDVEGFPAEKKQFFFLYWTKAQVLARSHPNVLRASSWLNALYHIKGEKKLDGVDLRTPLTYADRFRIRTPGGNWDRHPPHIDGGTIERWENETFRTCFGDILSGDWRQHDPYDLEGRINARSSMYGRPNQASIFRTFQGWLAMSETGPKMGTLKVFPDVILSNAYIILRPFFSPILPPDSPGYLDAANWKFDISKPDFPGLYARDGGFAGPRPTEEMHPHMALAKTMTSVPTVKPGDMVFWHCDVVHAVEPEHLGTEDSAVMYIPAMPMTPQNAAYVQRQKESFVAGVAPPDFPKGSEGRFIGGGKPEHITLPLGRQAMGFPIEVT